MKIDVKINLKQIAQNIKAYKGRVIFMVKGDAYGHGLVEVSKYAEPLVYGFGVATVDEGITLRDGLIMAVRALGYENDTSWEYKVEGANYWLPYYQKADALGIINKLNGIAPTAKLNRGETAQLIYNMLNARLYNKADDYNNRYTLADKVFGGKQTEDVESIVAGFISETPLQSIDYDTIPATEETVVITVLDEGSGNPVVEVPFRDLEKAGVDKLISLDNTVSFNYITYLSQRVGFLNSKIEGYITPSAEEKLLLYLRKNCDENDGKCEISVSMTELSRVLHISRASLYRVIEALEKQGKICRDGKKIYLKKEDEK